MFCSLANLTTIYAGSGWNTASVTNSYQMFYGTTKLKGGSGTTYSASYVDKTRAKIDGGTSSPGYFTAAGAKGVNGKTSSKNILSKSSIGSATISTSNSYTTESSCNNACGTTCLKSGNSYICPTYSCDNGVMSGTQCYDY